MADPKSVDIWRGYKAAAADPRSIRFFRDIQSSIEDIPNYTTEADDERGVCESGKGAQKAPRTDLLSQQRVLVNVILQEKIRGLLVFHGLGSGKTCASIASALALNKGKHIEQVVVLLPKSIRPNFEKEVESCRPQGGRLERYEIFHYNSSNLIDAMLKKYECADVNALIEKLGKTLFIVDESHRLVQMMHNALQALEKTPTKKKDEFRANSKGYLMYKILMQVAGAKIIFLSGTPLTNYAYEAAVLGNVLAGYTYEGTQRMQKYTLFPENPDIFYRKYVDEENYRIFDARVGDFERRFVGKITYFPNVSDSQFPSIKENKEVICHMSEMQGAYYSEMFKLDKVKGASMRSSMTSTYRIYSRMSANFVFPADFYERYLRKFIEKNGISQTLFAYSDFMSHGPAMKQITERNPKTYVSIIGDFTEKFRQAANLYFYRNLGEFSCKYAALHEALRAMLSLSEPRKTLIYSNFKNYAGLYTIELLLNSLGLKKVVDSEAAAASGVSVEQMQADIIEREILGESEEEREDSNIDERADNDYEEENEEQEETQNQNQKGMDMSGGARGSEIPKFKFPEISEILDATEIRELERINKLLLKKRGPGYLVYAGKNLSKVVARFNENGNENGDKIPILVITSAGAEGISLEQTRYVHIMEPYWNQNRTEQVIGRARRRCSHERLAPEFRDVSVSQYISVSADEKSVDQSIMQIANEKKRIIDSIYDIFRDVSVDCAKLGNRPTCTEFKYDMSTYEPKTIKSKYLYDYFDKEGRQRYDNINRYSKQMFYKMYPLVAVGSNSARVRYYLGQDKDDKWKIVELVSGRDGTFYTATGSLNRMPEQPEFYVVSDAQSRPLYKLRVDELKARRFERIELGDGVLGSESPSYPLYNNNNNNRRRSTLQASTQPSSEFNWQEMD
jgi:hypothetical protein